jgi:uncharacterized membrane protein (UPF0127 family)
MRVLYIALPISAVAAIVFVFGQDGTEVNRMRIGNVELAISIADDPAERARGLGGRAELSHDHAMLFMFPSNGRHGIWMKDMRIPIDIVWLDEGRTVVDVRGRVAPETYPEVFTPRSDSRYVVELASGAADTFGIVPGVTASF